MNTQRVPTLDWPKNLFRDSPDLDLCEAPANPFLEAGDVTSFPELLWHSPRAYAHECALAA